MWWIKNVNVIDPEQGINGTKDVLIKGEKILELCDSLTSDEVKEKFAPKSLNEVDGSEKVLFPGLIDVHVHLREPGREDKEEIKTGAEAAVRGGFTTILAMPNTEPVLDQRALIEFVINQATRAKQGRIYPIAAITKGQLGKELVEMVELAEVGAAAFSDDGKGVQSPEMMRLALEYAKLTDRPIVSHCEDNNLANNGVMHRGLISTRLGLKGIPSSSESVMVARDILLAEETGGKLHLAHISTKESVEIIRAAKKRGVNVTAEVNPHHLIFTDEAIAETHYNTSYKVNPPLRTDSDREALLEGLIDGTIDMLATDHAPHTWEEKTRPFDEAPFGISGLETALPALWKHLVTPGKISPEALIKAWSSNPAKRFNLPGGTLKPKAVADVVLFDPNHAEQINEEWLVSKGKNTPFIGKELQGFPTMVWVGGRLVYQR